jgi:hypothetical protein
MNRLVFFIFLLLSFGTVRAQISVDLQAGWAYDKADEFIDSDGFTNSVSVMYTPSVMGGRFSYGLSQEGTFDVGGDVVQTTNRYQMDYVVDRNVLGGIKLRYDFASSEAKLRPYLSVVLGVGNIKSTCSIAYQDPSVTPMTVMEYNIRSWKKTYFGIKPEIGIAYGVFTLGIGCIVPPSWKVDGRSVKYFPLQMNVGARFKFPSKDEK